MSADRGGEAGEAAAVAYLVSDDASVLAGVLPPVDGRCAAV